MSARHKTTLYNCINRSLCILFWRCLWVFEELTIKELQCITQCIDIKHYLRSIKSFIGLNYKVDQRKIKKIKFIVFDLINWCVHQFKWTRYLQGKEFKLFFSFCSHKDFETFKCFWWKVIIMKIKRPFRNVWVFSVDYEIHILNSFSYVRRVFVVYKYFFYHWMCVAWRSTPRIWLVYLFYYTAILPYEIGWKQNFSFLCFEFRMNGHRQY